MSQDESRPLPAVVDRSRFHEQLEVLRAREKAHTREGDAIAAVARRRLPMVEVAANSPLLGPHGPVTLLEAFESRRQLIAYYFMWWPGRPAAEQCEGCTWVMSHVGELAYLHSRDITFAVLCQGRNTAYGPGDAQTSYDESLRYRTFMEPPVSFRPFAPRVLWSMTRSLSRPDRHFASRVPRPCCGGRSARLGYSALTMVTIPMLSSA